MTSLLLIMSYTNYSSGVHRRVTTEQMKILKDSFQGERDFISALENPRLTGSSPRFKCPFGTERDPYIGEYGVILCLT